MTSEIIWSEYSTDQDTPIVGNCCWCTSQASNFYHRWPAEEIALFFLRELKFLWSLSKWHEFNIYVTVLSAFQGIKRTYTGWSLGKTHWGLRNNMYLSTQVSYHIVFLVCTQHQNSSELFSFFPSPTEHPCIACVIWYIFVVGLHRGKTT